MLSSETILNRMNFIIETEVIKDPCVLDKPNQWAFFLSHGALRTFYQEIYSDIYLSHNIEKKNVSNYQGYVVFTVDELKGQEIYFGKRRE